MKIAIPMDDDKQTVCIAFGRAPLFAIHDTDTNETTFEVNPAADAPGGAGLQSAQFVVDQQADTLITVRCGENAAEVFQMADIRILKAQGKTLFENLQALQEGKLAPLTSFHAGFHGKQ